MNNISEINKGDDIQQNLYFTVGENKYAIPLKNVLEVMKLPELQYPQKLPNNIVGILKFNNIVVNVIDIRFYLKMQVKPYSVLNKLIIVKTDESMFGIIADEIDNIIDIDISKIKRLPFVSENKIVDSFYHVEDNSVSILNLYAVEQLLRNGVKDCEIDIKTLFPTDKKSIEVFKNRSNNLEKKLVTSVNQTLYSEDRVVSFALNETIYGINLKYVKEVTNKVNMIPIPCSPDYIEGLMTIRGDFFTIFNLKKFLNLMETGYKGKTNVIIIDSDELKIGFLVDEIYEISDISEEQIENKRAISEDLYIYAEIIENDKILNILNMDRILSDEKLFIEEV